MNIENFKEIYAHFRQALDKPEFMIEIFSDTDLD